MQTYTARISKRCVLCNKPFTWEKAYPTRLLAESAEEWADENIEVCAECRRKEWAEGQRATSFSYQKALEPYNLPPLKGSEKQIEKADIIRYNAIGQLNELLSQGLDEEYIRLFQTEKLRQSAWWIKNSRVVSNDLNFMELCDRLIDGQIEQTTARVEVTCQHCNRKFIWEQLCPTEKDVKPAEEWARKNIHLCPECYKNRDRYETDAELEKHHLPLLTGTQKQVVWANSIRTNALGNLLRTFKGKAPEELWEWVREITTAAWWIENREVEKDLSALTQKYISNNERANRN